jgi:hypothetical protein
MMLLKQRLEEVALLAFVSHHGLRIGQQRTSLLI